jgi:hypothetical protein
MVGVLSSMATILPETEQIYAIDLLYNHLYPVLYLYFYVMSLYI